VARHCVWSRNLKNEEAKACYGAVENTTTMGCNARKTNKQYVSDWSDGETNDEGRYAKWQVLYASNPTTTVYLKPTAKQSVITKNTKLGIWPQLLDDEVKHPLSHKTPLLCTVPHSIVQSTVSPIY